MLLAHPTNQLKSNIDAPLSALNEISSQATLHIKYYIYFARVTFPLSHACSVYLVLSLFFLSLSLSLSFSLFDKGRTLSHNEKNV